MHPRMTQRDPHLPDFSSPPVVETVFGVSFEPIHGWRIPHYGLFWNEIRSDYPKIDVQPPIQFERERYGPDEWKPASPPTLELLTEPLVRCWFLDGSETVLLQVQRDGFLHNWRKQNPSQTYPHYENTRPAFERDWRRFLAFLQRAGLAAPVVSHCEVTYVNHLEHGTVWENFSDLPSLFPSWTGARSGAFLPDPDGLSMNMRYSLPKGQGRLRVSIQPAVRITDGKRVLEFKLTARGPAASSDTADVLKWFDLGREWIVRGFTDLTSEKAHKVWKRIQ